MKNNSMQHITILNSIGVFLVVFGHSLPGRFSYDDSMYVYISYVIDFIYTFHMPLFFFISGFLFSSSKKITFVQFFNKRWSRLILPYITFTIFSYFLKIPFSSFAQRALDFSLNGFFHALFFPWENPVIYYWFLPTLFIVSIVFYLILMLMEYIRCNRNFKIFIIILVSFVVAIHFPYKSIDSEFLNYSGVFYHLPFYLLGFFYYKIYSNLLYCFLMFMMFVVLFLVTGYDVFSASLIVVSLLFLSRLLSENSNEHSLCKFNFISLNGMYIYMLSFFFLVPVSYLVRFFTQGSLFMFVISLFFGMSGPILVRSAVKRSSVLNKVFIKVGLK